ncbi:MAG TPA: LPXTG cell wall anchor domain-containing protein [Thermoanaerobaculia bacterium]|jgi:LPXTG-motif cell wall-anchored protein|nr:LPXTG cell wall anchor domain-containing protein [Thermoanaerobaculia bacterium]
MKRQMLMLLTLALVLVAGTALVAQTTGTTQLPPSQQIDQSGKPETGPGPDVDVDVGKNAEDGVMDVDVKRHTDADTAAQGNDDHTTMDHTTATTGTTGTNYDNNTTTGTAADNGNLPATGSEMPLLGLIGLCALAGAAALRASR